MKTKITPIHKVEIISKQGLDNGKIRDSKKLSESINSKIQELKEEYVLIDMKTIPFQYSATIILNFTKISK